jgi:hypothetical protein
MDYENENENEYSENVPCVNVDGVTLGYEVLPEPYELDRVQVSFPDAENGYQTEAQEAAPLGWCNSAAVTLDRKEDSVTLSISVGDPRGAFTLTVRRLTDGTLVMDVPYPEETQLHRPLRQLHTGTYQIG